MKIVRYLFEKKASYGILDNSILELAISPFDNDWDINTLKYTGRRFFYQDIKLLTPCTPSKYLGVGLNFKSAAIALNRPVPTYPLTFMKPTTAIIPSGAQIIIDPKPERRYLYEGELAVVIGKITKNVSPSEALNYVLGYTCTNDITDFTEFGKDDLKLKGADTFGPLGPCIETSIDPENVHIRSWKNGLLRQDGNSNEMIFSVRYMISFFSQYMTLLPGDVIAMGTPTAACEMNVGDIITIEVDGIGKLVNYVSMHS